MQNCNNTVDRRNHDARHGLSVLMLAVGLAALGGAGFVVPAWADDIPSVCVSGCDIPVGPTVTDPPEETPQTPEEEFLAFLDSAKRLVAMGKLDRARAELDEALRLFPDDQEALALKQQLEGSGSLAEAQKRIEEVQNSAPPEVQPPATASLPPNADASVVDTRGLGPFGANLPKVQEIERSPGVNEWRKGMQAVANHDWPVALAWFQQALLKDPNNPALLRAEDLGKFMVAYYQRNGGARPVFDPAWQQYERERLAKLPATHVKPEDRSVLKGIENDADFLKARDRIVAKQEKAEADAAVAAHQDMMDRLESLRVEAGLKNWAEITIKEHVDPAFAARVKAERDAAVAQWVQDEQAARSQAVREMTEEVNRRIAAANSQ